VVDDFHRLLCDRFRPGCAQRGAKVTGAEIAFVVGSFGLSYVSGFAFGFAVRMIYDFVHGITQ
jgi:hypothetical protein